MEVEAKGRERESDVIKREVNPVAVLSERCGLSSFAECEVYFPELLPRRASRRINRSPVEMAGGGSCWGSTPSIRLNVPVPLDFGPEMEFTD